MNELALFAGAGGGILGGKLLGWRTVCAVEINEYCQRILMQRQDDGILEPFPIWPDIRTFDGKPWAGCVDIVTGGFPCQDISAAGKGAGIDGERSGLWVEMARIIREVRPSHVLVENSPMLCSRGLGRVLGDLAEMGFDAEWGVLGAADVGAPHLRERIWIVANANGGRCNPAQKRQMEQPRGAETECTSSVSYPDLSRQERQKWGEARKERQGRADPYHGCWWDVEPDVVRVVHGVSHGVERIRALGNAQVPAVVRAAWRILTEASDMGVVIPENKRDVA